FLAQHGSKLTITSFVARAISKALREYPFLNSSLEDDTIVVKRFVNLGIAVSVDQGIMVPVIKNCEALAMPELAKTIADLSVRARSGKLNPEDVKDGTITLTNFGVSGVMMGIPIIRYPEVAILGLGAIQKKVVALDDDTFGIRSIVHISLTFDHRVIDGMYGCGFLNSLREHLEKEATL
ncbi:MAG TPA: 2-oxo acid dehydrogenase subunit E2, partial [Candidatus Babeliaceae bacterium]|nr:2-oxo acid dehydrogenase subunit E2 [Candidatus Babeliaceae bacterium]